MGVEASSYQDLQLDDELPVSGDYGWTIHDARGKESGLATVFLPNKSSVNTQLVQNAAKQLRTLRHPSVLKFLALTKSSQGPMLVTEHVTPLELGLENLSAAETAGGIHNIIEALVFLHDRVGVSHNNVCLSSVYISDYGGWRLGGMEHVCTFQEATATYLSSHKPLRNEAALSPEEKVEADFDLFFRASMVNMKAGKAEPSVEFGHARDAYAFGVLAETLLENLTELGDMTKTFELRIQDELLHPDPKMRPHLRTLPADRLFRNEFLEIMQFLQHITLKSEEEKKVFFSCLVKKLYELPSALVASRLARPLLSRFVLLDNTALKEVIPHLLTPCKDKVRGEYKEGEVGGLLLTAQFKQHVVPELYKIFHVRDAHIRLVLLSCFNKYVALFDKTSLQAVILPQILLGLRDVNDELVRASLLAVAELVPILGGDVVIGTHRDKIFAEGVPNFGGRPPPETKTVKHGNINPSNGVPVSQRKDVTNNKDKETRTLKDMAKERDREKRREEMKLRNKERRRKREERKTSESTDKGKTDDTSSTNKEDSRTVSVSPETLTKEQNEINRTESSPEKAKWSDWETTDNARRTSVRDDDEDEDEEYDYDKEIEEELQQMGSMSSSTVFEPIERGPPVSVDWSDVQRTITTTMSDMGSSHKTRGMLKLKSKSKSSPPPKTKSTSRGDGDWGYQDGDHHGTVTPRKSASPKVQSPRSRPEEMDDESADFDGTDDWGDDWNNGGVDDPESPEHQGYSPPYSQSKSKGAVSAGGPNVKTSPQTRSHKVLGSEFDIKSIEVKAVTAPADPFDFFSDMQPVIKVKNPLTEMSERTAAGTESTKPAQSKLSFGVIETDDAADGWGDDGWGDDTDVLEEDIVES